MKEYRMDKNYSIAEARHNLAAIVHELDEQPEIALTRRGKTVAILLSIDGYRRLLPGVNEFWTAYTSFRQTFGPVLSQSEAEIFETVRDHSTGREVAL
jgi:antitoxin (DNA-binding transcriptional repressor) of toxin-antitoxin stability system